MATGTKNKKLITLVSIMLALILIAGTVTLVLTLRKPTVTIGASKWAIDYFDEKGITKTLEKAAKVHVKWKDYSFDPYTQAKSDVGVDTKNLPDAYLGFGLTNEQVEVLADDLFLELTDAVVSKTDTLKKTLAADASLREQIAVKGKLYSYPSYYVDYAAQYPQKVWVNQKWLQKLDLGLPATPAEFQAMLEAFKTKDPNGNGDKDEIPLGIAYQGDAYTTLGFLIAAFAPTEFDLSDAKGFLNVDASGKVYAIATDDRYKAALTYLNGLVKKNLLSKDVFTKTFQSLAQGTEDAEIYGVIAASDINTVFNNTSRAANYVALAPLNGGNRATVYKPVRAQSGGFFVAKGTSKQKEALAVGDALLSKDVTLALVTGNAFGEADKNATALGGEKALWKLNDGATVTRPLADKNLSIPLWYSAELVLGQQAKGNDLTTADNWQGTVNQATRTVYAPYGDAFSSYALPLLPLSTEQSAKLEKGNAQAKLFAAVVQNGRDFVTGKRDLKEWDAYVTSIEKLGLKDVVSVFQQAYDAQG